MILMRRFFLSVAKSVKFARMSSTTSGRSIELDRLVDLLQCRQSAGRRRRATAPTARPAAGSSRSGTPCPRWRRRTRSARTAPGRSSRSRRGPGARRRPSSGSTRTGVLASITTSGMPLTSSTRSARFSVGPARNVNCVVTTYWFCSRSSKSISRTVTCSPFGPNGIDRSPVSQAANSSLALTRPSVRTAMTMARSL